jgi:phage minor structural protein
MYKIYADDTLIYDSTIEDYKIGKGSITLETNKSGSFVFSLYPDHFYYDKFIRLKTVVTVYKSDKIVFRGRILNDVTDYWNNKVITCEGELGFLQDSIIRPFNFTGTPEDLFKKFIEDHNSQVDEFKRFKIGTVTVIDPNDYIYRNNINYESTLNNLNGRLINDSLGGYFYITHGEDDADPIPTLNYLSDFTRVSSQKIEFGSNLKNYTRTVKAEEIATAIIPLGAEVDDGNDETENPKLTIASINDGRDYVYDEAGVALYGWIFKTMNWDDVTEASNLKAKAEAYLESVMKQNITIELNAIDLHLLDKNIESFRVCDYVQVTSAPHNFDSTLLCNKQTLDLLKPENDSLILGYTYSTFTEINNKVSSSVSNIPVIQSEFKTVKNTVRKLDEVVNDTKKTVNEVVEHDIKALAEAVQENSDKIKKLEDIGGGVSFTTDETLKLENGVLSVNTVDAVETDNTLPITSSAVATTVGNINILLQTI